jgi:hypothetical protein
MMPLRIMLSPGGQILDFAHVPGRKPEPFFRAMRWSMIRKKPALGLDPRVETGFPKRSCSIKMLERQLIPYKAISL